MEKFDDKWTILAVLFLLRVLLGFDFQIAASVTPFWVNELNIDYAVAGSLIGCFMLPGIILAIPSGFLVHYLGSKSAVVMGLALMMTASYAASNASGIYELMFYRILSGSGAVILFIAMMGIVIDRFQGPDLIKSMSIYILGWPVGIGIGQATQAPLASLAGWQVVFVSCSMILLVGLAITVILYRSQGERPRPSALLRERPSEREHYLISKAGIIWMLLNGCYVIFLSYSPILLIERGMDIKSAALSASLLSFSFIITLPLAPRLLANVGSKRVIISGGLGGAGIAGLLLASTNVSAPLLCMLGLCLGLATPYIGSLPATILKASGRSIGLGVYFAWQATGSALLPIPGGYIKDVTGSAAYPLIFGAILLLVCVVMLNLLYWELSGDTKDNDNASLSRGQTGAAG